MLFQIIDAKKTCLGYYAEDTIVLGEEVPADMTQTWAYSPTLRDRPDIKFANLYCGGMTLDDACPPHLAEQWEHISGRLKAFFRSFMEAKISMDDNCFFELVPNLFLSKYYDIRNEITEYVFDNYERPENYWFLSDLTKMLAEISDQRLNIDYSEMRDNMHSLEARNLFKKIKKASPYCKYNIFGSKTGRLTTEKGSFPILTFHKSYRSVLKPNNDMFIELDFNAAELRTLLSLVDKEQPEGDLHDWNVTNIFRGLCTRDEAKKRIFSWLYNPNSSDYHCERFYNRQDIKERYWTGNEVVTPFGRTIASDEDHCVSYLIQSTCVDNTLRQMIRIWKLLDGRDSFVAFTLHDSVVIDFSKGDRDLFRDLIEDFADTDLGNFVINVSVGTNFGNMRSL